MNLSLLTTSHQSFPTKVYDVLIEQDSDDKIIATVLSMPECKASGVTEEEALNNLRSRLKTRLANAKIVSMKIEYSEENNPWLKLAGKYKDDSQFEAMLEYIEADRRKLDDDMELYYQQLDNQGK
jgi:predicted RNase H-like HicB family nuclease